MAYKGLLLCIKFPLYQHPGSSIYCVKDYIIRIIKPYNITFQLNIFFLIKKTYLG